MIPGTRPVSWIKAALKQFETFPEDARSICLAALTIAAEGGKADMAKPIRTPKREVDLTRHRLKRLKEMFR
jgi:phage-related protein